MQSFSRRRFSVTALNQVFERLPDANGTDETADDATPTAADQLFAPAGGHGPVEDVDFDTAIAEVLMTLAAHRGAVEVPRSTDERETAISERLDRQGEASFDDDGDSEHEDAENDGDELDPEAILAAEAATFRLLGELDRLWHRTA